MFSVWGEHFPGKWANVGLFPAQAPKSSKQGAKKSFKGAHGERRTRDAQGVEFEAPSVERRDAKCVEG